VGRLRGGPGGWTVAVVAVYAGPGDRRDFDQPHARGSDQALLRLTAIIPTMLAATSRNGVIAIISPMTWTSLPVKR
jgi:hypothetical protein